MKLKTIITGFALAICTLAMAQDKKQLEQRAGLLHQYTVTEQYEKLLDLTYPKLFDLLPREKMVEVMQRMTKGDGFTIRIMDVPPNFTFGEIKKIDGASYCVVKYDQTMKMTFTDPVPAGEKDVMIASFKSALKTDNVLFDEKDNSFTITKKGQAVAVADKLSFNQWTFINNSDGPVKEKLLSDKIIKELGI